ncbi:MAG: YgiQ family radical SAM protein [Firmicutes bacterium]|nr:YgiQ family radical SAM protein [Bacillota bacterium]
MFDYLPISKKDMKKRGWDQVDFVLITGDAYVDHPSFGTAIISRVLESRGYKVAILSQPDWKSVDDFRRFGRPRLAFLINSGNVDSMVNHFSVFKHRRRDDAYSPGGKAGKRPDRAVTVYSNRAREAYKGVPVLIGGLEASLRRFGHYDYWDDKVRRSILLDSKADILMYGMGERTVVEIAEALDSGIEVKDIGWIKGTCVKGIPDADDVILPDFDSISGNDEESKANYCKSFAMQYRSNDAVNGKRFAEKYGENLYVIQNPPQPPLEREELDDVYALPFMRNYHPSYEALGGVPAITEVKYSIAANRGCFGGCAFCAITYHQGREVRSRSKESIVNEAKLIASDKDFKGYIHDVGGPTANFRNPSCKLQLKKGMCQNKDCLFPHPCKMLEADHSDYLDVLHAVRNVEGVKKVFIRSGIRYDYMLADKTYGSKFLKELCENHVSGILKVAPEHISDNVLCNMHKPGVNVFDDFCARYKKMNEKIGKKQFMVPYFISSHPGSTLDDAIELALYLKNTGFVPDQVQDFYPTPGTLATCMYYTERNPLTGEPVYVAKNMKEKKMQRALMHFNKKENRQTVREALEAAGRPELIPVLLGKKVDEKNKRPDTRNRKRKKRV